MLPEPDEDDALFLQLYDLAETPEGAADLIKGVGLWDPEGDNHNLTSVKKLYSLDENHQETILEVARGTLER